MFSRPILLYKSKEVKVDLDMAFTLSLKCPSKGPFCGKLRRVYIIWEHAKRLDFLQGKAFE